MNKPIHRVLTAFLLAFGLEGPALRFAAADTGGTGGRDYLRLVCTFDGGLNAREGAANPFPAAGNVQALTRDDRPGGAARFAGHDPDTQGRFRLVGDKSAMVWDAANVPPVRGTVGFSVRWSGERHWNDGRRTWLAALPPAIDEVTGTSDGTALVVFKDADNTLVLGVYHLWEGRVGASKLNWGLVRGGDLSEMAEPDRVAARLPVGHLPAEAWVPVRFAWDRASGRAWLAVGDEIREAEADLRPVDWHCLLLGSPPQIQRGSPAGFDGDLADLVVDARTPAEAPRAGLEIPEDLPPPAVPPVGTVPAVLLVDDPAGARMESVVRSHLAQVLRAQGEHGGWAFGSAWPSGLTFLSSKVVLPYAASYFNGSKEGNSAHCALRLLNGYLTLGDPAFLEGAERTARALLLLQQNGGYWPYYATWDRETQSFSQVYRPDIAPLEDHVQAHPIQLLWLLHELTGNEEYRAAADRGRDFVLRAQNPNGSWSHHYNVSLQAGQAARGHLRAGEINDHATSNQMLIMLVAYRRTGDPVYLASFLRAADWHMDAFVDGGAKGWAQQYDEHNNPIEARHFEPAAVSLSEGIHSAPRRLIQAYRLTGDRRYLEPVLRWRQWMLDNRIFLNEEQTRWGWHAYYDIETGAPFRMVDRERLPPDPRAVREGGFSSVLREVEAAERAEQPRVTSRERAMALLAEAESARESEEDPVASRLRPEPLVEAFDPTAGTWLFAEDSPTGPMMSPSTGRVSLLGWSVLLRRLVAGQLPLDHRLATLTRSEFGSPFYMLIAPEILDRPFTADEIAAARAMGTGPAR